MAEKSDSVSLVEGERVEVIEKTSQDWWFVRKVVTNEKGFVPPSVLQDSATYTHYMKDTLSKKIEKLPVLRSRIFFYLLLFFPNWRIFDKNSLCPKKEHEVI